MSKRFFIAALLLLSLAIMVPAQSEGPSWSERKSGLTPMELLPGFDLAAPDVNLLLEEDAERSRNRAPWRVAKPLSVNINVTEEANWESLADGSLLGRLRLDAPGALFLSAKFGAFQLPPGGELRLVSVDRDHRIGPYTTLHHNDSGRLGTAMVSGHRAVIEIYLPAGSPWPVLQLESVSYGYRDAFDMTSHPWRHPGPHPKAGVSPQAPGDFSCQRDINCPEGASYQDDKRAVVQGYDGAYVCTGTMINNTAEDCRYLYITADHCEWYIDPPTMNYYYWYENSGCGTADSTWQTTTGSVSLYTSTDADINLLELTGADLHNTYQLYFSGWDRTTSPPTSAAIISHPDDKPKQIATMPGPIKDCAVDTCSNGWGANWWRVESYSIGVTEGGSSGGGFLDENHLLRGVLTGGVGADCASIDWDEYGKINAVWSSLQPFLDPGNTGVTSLASRDYSVCDCPMTVDVTPDSPAAECLGDNLVLSAGHTGGTGPYFYQWTEDGVPLTDGAGVSGATTNTLTISKPTAQSRSYNCRVTDSSGSCVNATDPTPVTGSWAACGPNISYLSSASWSEVYGNGDSIKDPGETWSVQVTVTNDGIASATNVTAQLSSADATLCSGPQSFGDVAMGANASATFSMVFAGSLSCGDSVSFNLVSKQSTEGSYFDESDVFSTAIGGAGTDQVATAADFSAPAFTVSTVNLSPNPSAAEAVNVSAGYTATARSNRVNSALLRHVGSGDTTPLSLPSGDGVPVNDDVTAFYNSHGPGAYQMEWDTGAQGAPLAGIHLTVTPLTCSTWSGTSCLAAATPPPVADGVSGTGITLVKGAGDQLTVTYDTGTCSDDHVVVLYGTLGNFSDYAGSVGAGCNAGSTGSAGFDFAGDNVWFSLVWVDGSGTAGHPGFSSSGARSWTATGECGISGDDTGNGTCN